ncbi:hypothetical protein [Streptomyces lichenis]|uniref:Uncharacterized protein n=1 Tax=Streptomyces lichenis TaxID=2306967 RepID=A0ABT0IFH8_9ACTN|nr:hypothetical protein [Streptomyces lichenis]MCK8680012.1 hypothetical protein [Streptomyces lichenis]
MRIPLMLALAGLGAQLSDGSRGMAYGVTSPDAGGRVVARIGVPGTVGAFAAVWGPAPTPTPEGSTR